MYTEDFIRRQINIAIAILRQLLHLKQAGQYEQARQEIEQSLEILLGLRADLLRQLEDNKVLGMLVTQDKLDIERLYLVAELYSQEAEIAELQEQPQFSQPSYQRALRFYLEAALADPAQAGASQIARISALQSRLSLEDLPLETQMALLDYLERLQGKSEAELATGGTSPTQVAQAIARLESQISSTLD